MKSKERRFLKSELAVIVCVASIWVELAIIDINIVNAAVQDVNETQTSTTDVNSIKLKAAKSKQAAQGQAENSQKMQNDDRYIEIDVKGRCKIERDRNGNVRSITLGGYTSSDKQKIDQYNNEIQKIKNNAQLTDFEKNKAILKINNVMASIQPTENFCNDLADSKRLEITQDGDKQMSQPNKAKEKAAIRINKELQDKPTKEADRIIPLSEPIGERRYGQNYIRGHIDESKRPLASDNRASIGAFGVNRFHPDSLANPFGAGSRYKADGLMNPFSQYGGLYSNKSWRNTLATNAPKLYDGQGNYRGKLSINPYDLDSISNPYGRYSGVCAPRSFGPIYVVPSE